ncbi:Response regulator ArlR [compost metagenome]
MTDDKRNGLQLALEKHWDLILLDLRLPGASDLDFCRQIRESKQTPIIILTARDSIDDKVKSLDCGADDYMPKPVQTRELLARMRALHRRFGSSRDGNLLNYRNLEIDYIGRTLKKNGSLIALTKREFDILLVLMKNQDRVITRETLLETVWGYDSNVNMKIVDVYISYLRNKIDEPGEPSIVQTIRGLGYVIRK